MGTSNKSAAVTLRWESEFSVVEKKSILALFYRVTVWGVETKILSFLIKYNAVLDFFIFFLNGEKWEIQDPEGF